MLTTGPQFATCAALVCGFFTCYGTVNIAGSMSWRLPFVLLTTLAAMYLLTTLFLLPDSPRWLILHGREQEADKVWDRLGVRHADRRDLEDQILDDMRGQEPVLVATAEPPGQETSARGHHAGIADLVAPNVRRRTFLAIFLMGFLQLCGIDGVLYVSHMTLVRAGHQSDDYSSMRLSFSSNLGSKARKHPFSRPASQRSLSWLPAFLQLSSQTNGAGGPALWSAVSV